MDVQRYVILQYSRMIQSFLELATKAISPKTIQQHTHILPRNPKPSSKPGQARLLGRAAPSVWPVSSGVQVSMGCSSTIVSADTTTTDRKETPAQFNKPNTTLLDEMHVSLVYPKVIACFVCTNRRYVIRIILNNVDNQIQQTCKLSVSLT